MGRMPSMRRSSTGSGNYQELEEDNLLNKFTDFAISAASKTSQIAQKTVEVAGGVVSSTADAVGMKDKFQQANTLVKNAVNKGRNDVNKAANKARRLANRAFDFDEDSSINSYDYDLLLSAVGAIEKYIAVLGGHTVSFPLPAGSALVWKARVKKFDIGFSVREQGEFGAVLEAHSRYTPDMPIQGQVTPSDRIRTIVLHFDNSNSALQGKTVVYWVAIGENVSLSDDAVGAARSKEMTAAEEGPALD